MVTVCVCYPHSGIQYACKSFNSQTLFVIPASCCRGGQINIVTRTGTNGCGMNMTMMGTPQVTGAGVDCNNYLDVRDMHHTTDQATFRVDQTFTTTTPGNSGSVRNFPWRLELDKGRLM